MAVLLQFSHGRLGVSFLQCYPSASRWNAIMSDVLPETKAQFGQNFSIKLLSFLLVKALNPSALSAEAVMATHPHVLVSH
jgi:hypothetical protein